MKKMIRLSALAAVMMYGFASCVNVAPDAGEEAVLIHKPFGPMGASAWVIVTGTTVSCS